MILFTSHAPPSPAKSSQPPLLVREGFSWSACLWGAFYLAAHRAWIAAALNMAAALLTVVVCRLVHSGAPLAGLLALQGLLCPDLLRWSLAQRGFAAGPVVGAADHDQALARLLDARPDLIPA